MHTDRPKPLWRCFSPRALVLTLWSNRELAFLLARREIEARYKAQALGLLWAVLTPLVLLATYTFVFAVVFPARWGTATETGLGYFALNVFAGLLVFNVFREIVARSPGLVVANRNYVKRIVFPLEVLSVADLLVALFTLAINSLVWLAGWAVVKGTLPHGAALLLPVLILPVCLAALGVSWFLSTFGTFLRDLQHVVELALTVLMFLTPIFYSLEAVPAPWDAWIRANPIAEVIEAVRAAAMTGAVPDWTRWGIATAASFAIALLGFGVFQKGRRAFADVL